MLKLTETTIWSNNHSTSETIFVKENLHDTRKSFRDDKDFLADEGAVKAMKQVEV